MKTVVICNQKGGASKTTTAAALAGGIARRGYRVLAIDADPQHNLTDISAASAQTLTLADVIDGKPAAAAVRNTTQGFDLIPGALELAELPDGYNLDTLKAALENIAESYDFCIVDTPPALSLLTMSALVAAQYVVIPAKADILSLYGLDQLQETIEAVRPYNEDLKVSGILLTQHNGRSRIAQTMQETISQKARDMGTRLFDTSVRPGVIVQEAQLLKRDIYTYAPKAAVTGDFDAFVGEFLKGVK